MTKRNLSTPPGYRKTITPKGRVAYAAENDQVLMIHEEFLRVLKERYHGVKMLNQFQCVRPHLSKRFFLKIDIEDAFGSLSRADVESVLHIHFEHCEQFFFHKEGGLIQGAKASPWIWHLYCLSLFDMDMYLRCKRNKLAYTRYCDDILISSHQRIPKKLRKELYTIIRDTGLKIKEKKTEVVDRKLQSITFVGIHFTKGIVTATPEFMEKLDACLKKGGDPNKMEGLASWAKQILALKRKGDML